MYLERQQYLHAGFPQEAGGSGDGQATPASKKKAEAAASASAGPAAATPTKGAKPAGKQAKAKGAWLPSFLCHHLHPWGFLSAKWHQFGPFDGPVG